MQEIVVLEPLGKTGEVDDFPGLKFVPDGDGKFLGLLGGIVHHTADVVAPVIVGIFVFLRYSARKRKKENKHKNPDQVSGAPLT